MFTLQTFHKKTPFKDIFTISNGRSKIEQDALLVKLSMGNLIGWGESPAITYYNVDVPTMISKIESKKIFIEKYAMNNPDRFWHFLNHLFPKENFIINALDMAYWDIYAQIQQKPLYQIFKTNWQSIPANNYTLGIDTIEKTINKIKENPFPIYKIKLGFENDMEYLQQICTFTNAKIRIDVNGNWGVEEAINKIKICNNYNIECIEQPLSKNDFESMKILMESTSIVLMADESCVYEDDVEKCTNYFHAINIKLTKCGGITPALRMIHNARNIGLKIMIGNMNESIIGTAAIQHFLPLLDMVDMDGLFLLNTHFIDFIFNADFTIKEPTLNGLGIPSFINPI